MSDADKTSFAAGGTESKRAEFKTDADYASDEADLTLISADAIPTHFRVHSFFLQAASPVFRSMIQTCSTASPPSIHFSDPKLERAVVLKLLLRLCCNDPTINFDGLVCSDVLDLIRLAQKWDCAAPLRIIELFVRQPIRLGVDVFHRFFFACALDDEDTAVRFLPDAAALKWPERPPSWPRSVYESLAGASKLDPANMSAFWLDQLPRKYFLALLRSSRRRSVFVMDPATAHTGPRPPVPTPWVAVAEDFRTQLKLQNHALKRTSDVDLGGMRKKTKKERVVDCLFDDEDADATIESSDGVIFKVHSFFLKAASPVFRSMIKDGEGACNELEFELTDVDLERASILRLLLDFTCHKPLENFKGIGAFKVIHLIHLAQKWEFVHLLQMISLHTQTESGVDAHHRFFYACALDEVDLAHRLFPLAAELDWDLQPGEPSVHVNKEDASCLDPTGLSSEYIDILPRKYFLALLRAWNLRVEDPDASWREVADEFRKQVMLQNKK